jgi:hypothetical protein
MGANDHIELNKQRVKWAQISLDVFQKQTRCDSGKEGLCDLLSDLRHWADKANVSWEESLATAMRNYRHEVD